MESSDAVSLEFNDNPYDWDDVKVQKFMQYLSIDPKLIDKQAAIRYKGTDYLMYDEEYIFRFYKAQTLAEQQQLRQVRDAIHQKSSNYNSSNLEDSEHIVESRPLIVTGEVGLCGGTGEIRNTESMGDLSFNCKPIEMEHSKIVRYNQLPYDPFNFETNVSFEVARTTFLSIMKASALYKSYCDYKQQRGDSQKVDTEVIIEVKKTIESQKEKESGQQTNLEKYAIKELQSVNIGSQGSDILLKDKAVSRKHAMIENRGTDCFIKDLGSSCGTFIRVKNTSFPLAVGSIFECGFQEFQVNKLEPNGDAAKLILIVIEGNEIYKKKAFELNIKNRLLIGKDPRCEFGSQFSEDRNLSMYHAKLSVKDNVVSIMDLDSSRGTWLRLSPAKKESQNFQITHETEIKINPYQLFIKIISINCYRGNINNNISNNNYSTITLNEQNEGAESFSSNIQKVLQTDDICINCKVARSNILLLPCNHVIYCKNCFNKVKPRICQKYDCKNSIQKVETVQA